MVPRADSIFPLPWIEFRHSTTSLLSGLRERNFGGLLHVFLWYTEGLENRSNTPLVDTLGQLQLLDT